MKHTEGPWKINEIGEIEAGGSILGRVYTGDIYPSGDEELDANARLIAAAPELLEALKECERYFDKKSAGGKWSKRLGGQVKSAIAKANL